MLFIFSVKHCVIQISFIHIYICIWLKGWRYNYSITCNRMNVCNNYCLGFPLVLGEGLLHKICLLVYLHFNETTCTFDIFHKNIYENIVYCKWSYLSRDLLLYIVSDHMSTVSASERRRYICNDFTHWLMSWDRPCCVNTVIFVIYMLQFTERSHLNSSRQVANINKINFGN